MSQSPTIGAKARTPNPALRPLEFLIGEWRTAGTHPLVPGKTLPGRTAFCWHEDGAFLIMRSQVDEPRFPDGLAIIGSDDSTGAFTMIYFDERGTSRLFDVSVGERTLTWRRDNPELSQTMTITAGDGGDRLIGEGRMSQGGGPWGDDLSQVYTRT